MRRFIRLLGLGLVPGLFVLGIAGAAMAANDGWLGVVTQNISEGLRDALDLKGDGVLVNRVVAGSPAERAGLRKGDIISSVNGRSVESPEDLSDIVQSQSSGSNASVKINRRGAVQTLSVRLGSRPADSSDDDESWGVPAPPPVPRAPRAPRAPGQPEVRMFKDGKEVDPEDFNFEMPDMRGLQGLRSLRGLGDMATLGRPRLGVRLQEMNPDLASYFGGTNGRGALVVEVIGDSPAEKAGIKAGDVILAVGSTNVDDTEDLVRAIADEDGTVSLTIVRKGARRTIEADLGDSPRSMTWRMRDGRAPRAMSGDGDATRREIQDLRDEIRELKKQLEDKNR